MSFLGQQAHFQVITQSKIYLKSINFPLWWKERWAAWGKENKSFLKHCPPLATTKLQSFAIYVTLTWVQQTKGIPLWILMCYMSVTAMFSFIYYFDWNTEYPDVCSNMIRSVPVRVFSIILTFELGHWVKHILFPNVSFLWSVTWGLAFLLLLSLGKRMLLFPSLSQESLR